MRCRKKSRGFTLVEMMVAIAASTMILMAFVALTIAMSRTMLAISNYNDLDNRSRNTLDTMSRDIRNASQLIGCVGGSNGIY
ncbi:MAG TPA: prepilin-type N-terminal cleavage/methylation domain-containing protein, partial [Verrucomicrobiae bacterium]|nr:prepilin-type N-terminal cleavage/methylation domain-containing protein [Verrucomicrobiae bacterium]